MGLFRYIFGTKAAKATDGTATTSMAPSMDATKAMVLPTWREDVAEWVPPPAVKTPAKRQAEALVALFQQEGRTGPRSHFELLASYPEVAWANGYMQLAEGKILRALGNLCDKVRRDVHVDGITWPRVIHYVIPVPRDVAHVDNVVAMKRAHRADTSPATRRQNKKHQTFALKRKRGSKRFASNPQILGQGKGGFDRAGISQAAACG
jgi:hypothetical protein